MNLFLKILNILVPIYDYLYILQLEEYDSMRFVRWLPKFFFRREISKREQLVMTVRVIFTIVAILLLSILYFVLTAPIAQLFWQYLLFIIIFPFIVVVANFLIGLLVQFIEFFKLYRLRQKIKYLAPNCFTILITGSYGKTSTKELFRYILQSKYTVIAPPGNINTLSGISNWLNKEIHKRPQICIIECDTFGKNEFAIISAMLQPKLVIITTVDDQHTERFHSYQNMIDAHLQAINCAPIEARLMTTKRLQQFLPQELLGRTLFSDENFSSNAPEQITQNNAHQDTYARGILLCALFSIPHMICDTYFTSRKTVERRGESKKINGFQCIDDSYNISFSTAISSIQYAKKIAYLHNKSLVLITAGIPEIAKWKKVNNYDYGKFIAGEISEVIILKSQFATEISAGIKSTPHGTYFCYANSFTNAIHEMVKRYSPDKHLILIQPELNDLYY